MPERVTTRSLLVILAIVIVFSGCSGVDSGPAAGTPAWYWQAAVDTFAAADFTKTQEHLENLTKSESEWQKRAAAWRLVVLSGLARGYVDLGDAYGEGARENEAQAAQFRNPIQQYRRYARQYAINLTESVGPFQKLVSTDESVHLDFSFPAGSVNQSPVLTSVSGGTLPKEGPQAEAEDAAIKRGILLQATLLSSGQDEVNKARSIFKGGSPQVPRLVFMAGLAKTLYTMAGLFDRLHLNEPDIGKILVQRSEDCLKQALEAEDEEIKKLAEAVQEEIDNDTKEREEIERRYRQAGL